MVAVAEALTGRFKSVITSVAELREIYPPPAERAVQKDVGRLDEHSRTFLALSPFVLLGTSSAAGECDVSPKGDGPGFVHVLDDHTIAIPDRVGNRRIDSLQNIVENPHVGLLFLIPGLTETLRINGSAQIVRDDELLDPMTVQGKRPNVAIVVTVENCFMHCAKAFLRSELWNPSTFLEHGDFPSLAKILHDQRRPAERTDEEHARLIAETEAQHRDAYNCLY